MKKILTFFMALTALVATGSARVEKVKSPSGRLQVVVDTEDGNLHWQVLLDARQVLAPSAIQAVVDGSNVIQGTGTVARRQQVSNTLATPVYFRQQVTDNYGLLVLKFKKGVSVEFRAYDDGATYRIITARRGKHCIDGETAEFCFDDDYQAFIPYVNDLRGGERYSYSFESYYDEQRLSEMFADSLAITPLCVCLPGGVKAVVMDCGVENYPGMMLVKGSNGSHSLTARFAPYITSQQVGGFNRLNIVATERAPYLAVASGPLALPWRAVVVTEDDARLADCDMAMRLAPASRLTDTSWIRAGKVAWDWWNNTNIWGVDFESGMNTSTYKYYIDFAQKNRLEYIIIDEGWSSPESLMILSKKIDLLALVQYAKERGIGIIQWSSWRNMIGKTAQDNINNVSLNNAKLEFEQPADSGKVYTLDEVMAHYQQMGIKGFKVDFFDRDDQQVIASAYKIAESAARYHLYLDYHGLKPFGIQRAYPNIFNFEGVKGLENSKWEPRVGDGPLHNQPRYDVSAPYLRMLAGPMDYTPGAMTNAMKDNFFGNNDHPMSQGTRVHQMAMYTTFEAPLQMMADSPTKYMQNQECTDFIAQVPTTFDETIALDGQLGEYTVIARRKGSTWYLAAMTDWTPRDLTIDLSFLGEGQHQADIFADGVNAMKEATDYKHTQQSVTKSDRLSIHLSSGGGWTAIIR